MTVHHRLQNSQQGDRSFLLHLAVLSLLFALGVILGQVLSQKVPDSTRQELTRYLKDYLSLNGTPNFSARTFLSALFLYFRYPMLAFLVGFASAGILLLPALTVAYGFFLSFSICSFAAVFGSNGVLLALAVFGLRCLITVPSYFFLAVPSMRNCCALASASFGHGKRVKPAEYGLHWWMRAGIALLILLAGTFAEKLLTPYFLNAVLAKIFT